MDRRVKRTKMSVFNAVLDLLTEKEANKITVLEVCKRADINKSTFYLHYSSMNDCLQKCFSFITDGIIEFTKLINYDELQVNPKPTVDKILNEVEKNSDYLTRFKMSNITGNAAKVFKQQLVSAIAQSNGYTKENNYYAIATITFIVAGCFDTIIEMLPDFNKEETSKVICEMIKSTGN